MDQNDNNKNNNQSSQNLFEIAAYYTNGDKEKAQLMVTGAYHDMYALKVKFSALGLYGACLYFINRAKNALTDLYCIVTASFSVDDIKTELDWQDYETQIIDNMNQNEHDNTMVFKYLEICKNSLEGNILKNIQYLIEINDINALTGLLKKEIFDKLEFQNAKIDIGYDEISSLDMELNSKTSIKLTPEQLSGDKSNDNKEEIEEIKIEPDEEDQIKPEDVKLILDGALVLSPTGGMNIEGLVVKDSIKIKITDKNPKGALIAKAFNAYKEGRMLPIEGKIVSFRRKMEGGFKLFVEIADGIYIRINEDEENIKVAFVSPSPDRPPELQKGVEKYVDKYIESQKKEEKVEIKKSVKTNNDSSMNITVILVSFIIVLVVAIFGIILLKFM